MQVIIVKTDGTKFSYGDSWKCITCGVPDGNAIGIDNSQYDYPQAFRDGSRLLVGHNVLECGAHHVTSDDYTPDKSFIYPLRWNIAADGSDVPGAIRELRLHPDNVHIEFSSFTFSSGSIGQFAYFARLSFNHSPSTGRPVTPRYDLVNVTQFYNPMGHVPLRPTEAPLLSTTRPFRLENPVVSMAMEPSFSMLDPRWRAAIRMCSPSISQPEPSGE